MYNSHISCYEKETSVRYHSLYLNINVRNYKNKMDHIETYKGFGRSQNR